MGWDLCYGLEKRFSVLGRESAEGERLTVQNKGLDIAVGHCSQSLKENEVRRNDMVNIWIS